MKKLLTTAALATLVASPAFAASYKHAGQTATTPSNYSAYASARVFGHNAYASVLDRDTVAAGGEIVGRDPDAGIRLQLRRDPEPSQY
jgi:hypothetical protein